MSVAIFFFLAAGVLLVAGVILREREVPATGSIGRGHAAQLISLALAVCVITAATLTFVRLIAMAV
ncbi:hypothetical protein CJ178_14175 [Rhodococcus sp. ACPA4]|jgi:hypothetical protein|uniref:Uncharacterized protein n=2 Tax=Nocardiaceae TaxID=85025 RepID=A0A652YLX7_NOCGL|nr:MULTISPECIES: hypothetical protein [Rhodococcus]NMD60076.1 hypothetical protein [Nocardia globerula]KJF23703.1 hypothetical protein SZ00_00620 [Rhodococcus sp. AD45]MDV6266724.1 hypothetical protein [Rhodococcus globerulus]MDV8069149.1 hypothetical protein [Rhodococcus sp. IEGM 1366]NRI67177.1 hypothetical protein [Rhodococcus sp. MS16]